jgi:hypothetical protein
VVFVVVVVAVVAVVVVVVVVVVEIVLFCLDTFRHCKFGWFAADRELVPAF